MKYQRKTHGVVIDATRMRYFAPDPVLRSLQVRFDQMSSARFQVISRVLVDLAAT